MSPTPTTGDVFIIEDAPSLEPRLVEKLRGQSIASLAAGFTRTAVLTNPGTAQSITHAIDQLAPLDAQVAQVGFGGRHMAVRTHSSQVYTLGDNSYGQLGHGDTARSDAPRLLVQLQHVAQTGPVVQLQHVAATLVILPCQNRYSDSNSKALLIVVKEIRKLRYH